MAEDKKQKEQDGSSAAVSGFVDGKYVRAGHAANQEPKEPAAKAGSKK